MRSLLFICLAAGAAQAYKLRATSSRPVVHVRRIFVVWPSRPMIQPDPHFPRASRPCHGPDAVLGSCRSVPLSVCDQRFSRRSPGRPTSRNRDRHSEDWGKSRHSVSSRYQPCPPWGPNTRKCPGRRPSRIPDRRRHVDALGTPDPGAAAEVQSLLAPFRSRSNSTRTKAAASLGPVRK